MSRLKLKAESGKAGIMYEPRVVHSLVSVPEQFCSMSVIDWESISRALDQLFQSDTIVWNI
jgi:hypothetical protein